MNTKYKPVACHFYDELESAAVKRSLNKIIFINDENKEETIEDLILDFKTLNKEEFALLKSGLKIRLDKIINFNELDPKSF
ncbi:hypothetical protein ACH5BF_03995 [Arcobacter sp. YIC-464]|uniref:hypothetical protein n=1 Tax=Arcobacter sp. YIC-464 TaxID=3376631 RepID=UPI003C158AB8